MKSDKPFCSLTLETWKRISLLTKVRLLLVSESKVNVSKFPVQKQLYLFLSKLQRKERHHASSPDDAFVRHVKMQFSNCGESFPPRCFHSNSTISLTFTKIDKKSFDTCAAQWRIRSCFACESDAKEASQNPMM